VPRWQRDMLVALARKHGTSVDEVVTRELEDVACAHAEELAGVVTRMRMGMEWPERVAGAPKTEATEIES